MAVADLSPRLAPAPTGDVFIHASFCVASITDAGLKNLVGLSNLKTLSLSNTKVTDNVVFQAKWHTV